MSKIVGLTGYAQSGKDTVGSILTTHRGYTRLSFADNVREAVYRLNPYIPRRVFGVYDVWFSLQSFVDKYGWEKAKVENKEVRRLLQVMGTEVGREMFGETSWIDMVARQVAKHEDVVITDVRFKNEADFVRSVGGYVIRVNRPGTGPVNDHASDRIDFEPDAVIDNDGTLGALTAFILEVDSTGWSSLSPLVVQSP
jgi:hypothetical protein